MCEAQGNRVKERGFALRIWVGGVKRFSNVNRHLEKAGEAAFSAFFRLLERMPATEQLRYSEMRNLMRTLGIHPLLLDSLLSKPVTHKCLSIRLPTCMAAGPGTSAADSADAEFRQTGEKGTESYGSARSAQ
jgi:hypothetical protein